jgi:GH15 family glucan-1,4-alpha-glucosidase
VPSLGGTAGFTPIAQYAFLSDCHTGALVGSDGAIDCRRRYLPGTNVLETKWMTRGGWIVIRDALAIGPWREGADRDRQTLPPTAQAAQQTLIRLVECVQGQVDLEVVCEPMFDYAREPATWELSADEHGGIAHGRGKHGPSGEEQEIHLARSQTFHFWRIWLNDGEFPDHAWAAHLQRSALALRGLAYAPTGALVAALTTSLPGTPFGSSAR